MLRQPDVARQQLLQLNADNYLLIQQISAAALMIYIRGSRAWRWG